MRCLDSIPPQPQRSTAIRHTGVRYNDGREADLVDDILGQRLAVPLFIKFSISFHNIGTHLLDLRNTAMQANTKNVRGNMT
jgi:hypothetical protein